MNMGDFMDYPSKEEVMNDVQDSYVTIGASKHIWVDELELPEEEFDAFANEWAEKAKHIAIGDEEGRHIIAIEAQKKLLKAMAKLAKKMEADDAEYETRSDKERLS